MKTAQLGIVAVVVLVVMFVASPPFFVVREGEQAIVTQFGKPVGDPIKEAGLNLRIPFIQDVHTFEKRIQKWDGKPNQIPTRDKKYIRVDTTARWKITKPLLFLQTVATNRGALSRLDDIIDSVVRDLISSHNLENLVRSAGYKYEPIDVGRQAIAADMQAKAKQLTPKYGIELLDIQIKRLNYEENVQKRVFERMISERKRIASELRSEGGADKQRKLGQMQKELAEIRSKAYRTSQEIKGKADGEVTRIFGESFGQDPEFYALFKTLESYGEIPQDKSDLILSTDGDYFRYLKKVR